MLRIRLVCTFFSSLGMICIGVWAGHGAPPLLSVFSLCFYAKGRVTRFDFFSLSPNLPPSWNRDSWEKNPIRETLQQFISNAEGGRRKQTQVNLLPSCLPPSQGRCLLRLKGPMVTHSPDYGGTLLIGLPASPFFCNTLFS